GAGASPGCVCMATAALVIEPRLESVGGVPHFAWATSSQAGTVGFDVLREVDGEWRPVNRQIVPATVAPATRSDYRVEDADVPRSGASRYLLLEWDGQGRRIPHGPYSVSPDVASTSEASSAAPGADWPAAPVRGEGAVTLKSSAPVSSAAPRGVADGPIPDSLHLGVGETGWYRLSAGEVAAHFDVELQLARRWIKSGRLRLENLGEPVAWVVDARSESLVFFGEGPEALPAAWAEVAPANVYRLTPSRGRVARAESGWPLTSTVAPATYLDAVDFEEQVFPATLAATDPEADFWFWAGAAANTSYDTAAVEFDLPNLAPEGTSVLTVRLQGANRTGRAVDHRVEVSLNGYRLGDTRWAGLDRQTARFEVDSGRLREVGNELRARARVVTDGEPSFVYLDGFTVETRRFRRLHDPAAGLRMEVPERRQVIEVAGVPAGDVWVFDATDPRRPIPLTAELAPAGQGSAGAGAELRFQPRRPGVFWVVPSAALRSPASIRPWRHSIQPLTSPIRRADQLIVFGEDLRRSAEEWADYRRADGLEVEAIEMEQVYDAMTHGVATPHALRRFLASAAQWQLAPRFVLLVGDGHFDYLDRWGRGGNLVPPPLTATADGLFAADRWFLPAANAPSLGRLPATADAQVRAALEKVQTFESYGGESRALSLADDADAGGAFLDDGLRLLGAAPGTWRTRSLDLESRSVGDVRDGLFEAFGEGLTWLHFYGHGGGDRLTAEGVLTTPDVAALPTGAQFPLVTALTCNAGRFEFPGSPSLAGALTLEANRGAVATLTYSGLSFHSNSAALGESLADALFEPASGPKRLGDALRTAEDRFRRRGGSEDHLEVLHLFGDPALRLPE
ncbi:MAG: C25 family cysteine peptidase, partial [Acidobacteriota bacterium]